MSTPAVRTRRAVIHTGVHRVLMLHNVVLVTIGVVMIIIGHKISRYANDIIPTPDTHQAYLAVMPLAIGVVGIICAVIGHAKVLLGWGIYALFTCVGSYVFFVEKGYLTESRYGVTLKIYSYCKQEGPLCSCFEPHGVLILSTRQPCSDIRHVTSAYLCQMFLLTTTLAITIICCFLVFISYFVSTYCMVKHDEEESLLGSGIHSTPTVYKTQQTSVYMTDLTLSGQVRTCLTAEKPTGKTTL